MISIEELVRLAQSSREDNTEIRQGFVAVLWRHSASDLENLSVRFGELKMLNLRDVCRVIASMKQRDLLAQEPQTKPDSRAR